MHRDKRAKLTGRGGVDKTVVAGVKDRAKHGVGEYVKGRAHTNGMESFWSMLKRGYIGTLHRMSPEHLHRYVAEFEARHNRRPMDTIDQMATMFVCTEGRQLRYAT